MSLYIGYIYEFEFEFHEDFKNYKMKTLNIDLSECKEEYEFEYIVVDNLSY